MSERRFGFLAAGLLLGAALFWLWAGTGAGAVVTTSTGLAESGEAEPLVAAGASGDQVRDRLPPGDAAATREVEPGRARLAVRVLYVVGAARKPIEGVPIQLQYRTGADLAFDSVSGQSGEDGRVVLDGLRPGPAVVMSGRGLSAYVRVELKPGAQTVVDLELRDAITLSGRVEDEFGAGIAGAAVEVIPIGGDSVPIRVAETDSQGAFRVEGIPDSCAVGARAPGYCSGHVQMINCKVGDERSLQIGLRRGAGSVAGVVLDNQGQPVVGAFVRIGALRDTFNRVLLRNGEPGFARAHYQVRTDADGRFRAIGLIPGVQPVHVLSRIGAPWRGTVEIAVGVESPMRIHLRPGMTCRGVITMADGSPAVGCRVRVNNGRKYFCPRTVTGSDGSYCLTGIAPGDVQIGARHPFERGGRALVTLTGEPGAELTWNPQLNRGVVLRGRVETEAGRPLPETLVQVVEPGIQAGGHELVTMATADAKGEFRVENLPPGPVLSVIVRGSIPTAWMESQVDATAGLCVIKVPDPGLPTAQIRGTAHDRHGLELRAGKVELLRVADPVATQHLADRGQFAFDDLLPGDYVVCVRAPGFIPVTRRRRLAEGESWHLGDVALQQGGWVEASIPGITPVLRERLRLTIRAADLSPVGKIDSARGMDRSMPLLPGRYVLEVGGPGVAAACVPFDIHENAPTRVAIRPQTGVPASVIVRVPVDAREEQRVRLRVKGKGGLVLDRELPRTRGTLRPHRFALAPGRYHLTATLPDGRSAAEFWTVPTGGGAATVDLRIR